MSSHAIRQMTPPKKAAAFAALLLARLLMASWRPVWHLPPNLKLDGPAVWCLWHNRLAVSMLIYKKLRPRSNADGLAALISASQDGSFLAYLLKKFGVEAARGSSSRRGPQALREAINFLETNYHVAITPDGPKGPKYVMHDGVISLAQLTGRPIYPVSTYVPRKICLKSWDAFQIPMPFSRFDIYVSEPISVPAELTDDERATYKKRLLEAMQKITQD